MSANNHRHSFRYGAVLVSLFVAASVMAETPATHDVTAQFLNAGVSVEGLRVVEVGGIVVLRGRVSDPSAAEQAAAVAQTLGYLRVANLIQIADVPDDERIARAAERRLGMQRGLDGTQIAVASTNGVVVLRGTVSNEMQKDMAAHLVRNISGVRAVQIALTR
jgi:osmotically-inducible protein OsmY